MARTTKAERKHCREAALAKISDGHGFADTFSIFTNGEPSYTSTTTKLFRFGISVTLWCMTAERISSITALGPVTKTNRILLSVPLAIW